MEEMEVREKSTTYIPGKSRALRSDEELICDESAYIMLHKFELDHPCLSFDTLRNQIGGKTEEYPMCCYIVAGTQAEKVRENSIAVLKLTNLRRRKEKDAKKKEDDDEEDEEESSDSEDEETNQPQMSSASIGHHGGINRIRTTVINSSSLCAAWNDQGKVQIWNLTACLNALDVDETSVNVKIAEKPLFSFNGHGTEGFALDWSNMTAGRLLSGDNRKNIHLWTMLEGGQWAVDQRPFNSHSSSVEDIQWSPNEADVFASCSSDKSIRLWDCRVAPQEACVCTVENAHQNDVNVISWNSTEPLLVSGGDDGALKVWDLKFIQNKSPVAIFKHHTKAITSVHWYPHDSTVFCAAGADNQLTVWDLAVEADDVMENQDEQDKEADVAPQLMFIHSGQEEIKEIRWHPQVCGTVISTALDGFNIFRPMNL